VQLKVFTCRHVLHDSTTFQECSRCPDYQPPLERGKVRLWAVGVTTAPRERPTLKRTLESLADAGWEEPRLFAESMEFPLELALRLPISPRGERMGAFPNWFLGLSELILRAPKADAYFMCQDDVLFARGLRRYLEEQLWPAERLGVVSVYSAGSQSSRGPDGFHVDDRGWDVEGALGLIFPNSAARAFVGDPGVLKHRQRGPDRGMHHIDAVVGAWCARSGLPFYLHAPSLAQHIGDSSTLFPGAANFGPRHAGSFRSEIP
jgi:hypothetical protein